MGTTACLSIDTINVNNSKRVSWDDTSLVKMEAKLLLSLCLIHKVLVNCMAVVDDSVCLIFDLSLLFFGNTLVVSNIQMGSFDSFLCTILPNMGTKNLAARSKDDVSSSMMSSQLLAALSINTHMSSLAL